MTPRPRSPREAGRPAGQEPVAGELTEAQLEALLFVAEKPLSRGEIARLAGVDRETVDDRLGDLEVTLAGRGIRLVLGGDRVELTTAPEAGALIARYVGADAVRLSPAALETLAIVAYRQPVTKAVIERIRGVDSDYTVRALIHRRLVVEQGRADAPGRPILYGTGFEFLERFGITSLDELPALDLDVATRLVDGTDAASGPDDAIERRTTRPAARATRSTRTPDQVPADRISKVLAAAGVASRRGADELVAAGRVTVDGRPAVLGEKVDPEVQRVAVDGRDVGAAPTGRIYLALHKPAGVASTVRDRHAPRTVLDLVPAELGRGARLYPVGRLDQDSEGLILLTNDGDWAERVLHPRYGVEREYAVALAGPLTREQAQMAGERRGARRGRRHGRPCCAARPTPRTGASRTSSSRSRTPASPGSASPSTRAGSASCGACSARSGRRSVVSSGSGSGRCGWTRWHPATCGR